MSATKNCSKCRAEVPVLATMCKFCGARIAIPEDSDVHAGIPEISPQPFEGRAPVGTSETTVPLSEPEPIVGTKPSQATSDGSASDPLTVSRPSMAVPKERPVSRQKTLRLPLSSEAGASVVTGATGMGLSERGPRTAPPPPPFSKKRGGSVGDHDPGHGGFGAEKPLASAQMMEQVVADSSVLEMILEEVDDDILISLDDDDSAVGTAPEVPPTGLKKMARAAASLGQSSRVKLLKNLVSPRILDTLKRRGVPPKSRHILGGLRVVHGLGIAAGFAFLIFIIVLTTGRGTPPTGQKSTSVEQLVDHVSVGQRASSLIDKIASLGSELSGASAPAEACLLVGDLPVFPWRVHLEQAVSKVGKTGICHLFGLAPDDVVAAMGDLPHFGPTGYDLLPKAQVLEFFPRGKTIRPAPTLEFIFVDNRALEIRLKYGNRVGKKLSSDIFKELLGAETGSGTDHLGRKFVRYYDGDVVVEQTVLNDDYGRVWREISFGSKSGLERIKRAARRRELAEEAFAKGMIAFNNRRPEEALVNFRNAQRIVPDFGAAYIWEGMLRIGDEKFGNAVDLAGRAMEISRDRRTQAEARGIRGVAALYRGQIDTAVQHFQAASEIDPSRKEFSHSASELKTGRYGPARVAKTAARMSCSFDKKRRSGGLPEHAKSWTIKGLLARGNFPDSDAYNRALKKSKRSRSFKREYKRWVSWECR